ncbi:TIGR01620 family protein [Thalassotalea sp. G2M2-11]|uniref:YcjF family protein n=1 Tax=Thalassotalea sp. G2M2-11 TaxID=2787627 RepID=UPI0019D130A4|nr:TIGR01620 family protein [Thalassotalea sp. G2M2-11]
MSDLKDKPEQQILFDELNTLDSDQQPVVIEEQVFIENDELNEVEPQVPADVDMPNKPSWLWRIAISLLAVLVIIETVEFFILGFNQEPIIASLYGALLLILSLIVGSSALREYQGLRQLKRREKLKQQVNENATITSQRSAETLCREIAAQLPVDLLSEQEKQWQQTVQKELSNEEVLQLFSKQVLSKVDKKALEKVSKYSTESVVIVALSPIAIIDMLLMFWRNLKMIDEIAHLYGLRLSYWSRIKLIKQVFINMLYAGASELIADLGSDLLGADLLGKLSARLAQGLGAGMLTARLGLKAMTLCRPIPFDQQSPKLKDVRKQIIGQIKQLANKNQ